MDMKTKIDYRIYAVIDRGDIIGKTKGRILNYHSLAEFEQFKLKYKFYKAAQMVFASEYGCFPTFPEMRDIFDESDSMRNEQLYLTNNDENAIVLIKEFVSIVSHLWHEDVYILIKDISDFTAERKVITTEYYDEEL